MPSTKHILQGRYEVVREIAQGGMGAVYEARDRNLGQAPVAIKKALVTTDPLRRAFQQEALLLARLSHPCVPKVSNHFIEDNESYLVMEYVAGDDLESCLAKRTQAFPVAEVLQWAEQILQTLAYLHTQAPPIIHRDIKPGNLKLTPQGDVKLLDFGLAKGPDGDASLMGYTALYAPVEQHTKLGTDARSDLYALGATLYRLLTAQPPVSSLVRVEAIAKGQADPQPRADESNRMVPVALAQVIQKAMAVNADARYATAAEMQAALHQASPQATSDRASNGASHEEHKPMVKESYEATLFEAGAYERTVSGAETEAPLAFPQVGGAEAVVPAGYSPTAGKSNPQVAPLPVPASTIQSLRKQLEQNRLYQRLAFGFLLLLIGGVVWLFMPAAGQVGQTTPSPTPSPTPAQQKALRYEILVTRGRNAAAGQQPVLDPQKEVFSNGDAIQFKVTSPENGYLYIFNEGADERGAKNFRILFPTPKRNNGVAQVASEQPVETSPNDKFTGPAGLEKFWIIWTREIHPSLEAAQQQAFAQGGEVRDTDQQLRAFLQDQARGEAPAVTMVEGKYRSPLGINSLTIPLTLTHQ